MKRALPRVSRSALLWRRVASANAARALVLCAVFAGLIAIGVYRTWQPEIAPSMKLSGAPVGLALSNSLDGFSETRIGQLLYWPEVGVDCRRVLFDNRTGLFAETDSIPCDQTRSRPEPASEMDRLTALRKAFQK